MAGEDLHQVQKDVDEIQVQIQSAEYSDLRQLVVRHHDPVVLIDGQYLLGIPDSEKGEDDYACNGDQVIEHR